MINIHVFLAETKNPSSTRKDIKKNLLCEIKESVTHWIATSWQKHVKNSLVRCNVPIWLRTRLFGLQLRWTCFRPQGVRKPENSLQFRNVRFECPRVSEWMLRHIDPTGMSLRRRSSVNVAYTQNAMLIKRTLLKSGSQKNRITECANH